MQVSVSFKAIAEAPYKFSPKIAMIGGGNSALEEAVALTNYATKITIIYRLK